jgi:hypothetical protein
MPFGGDMPEAINTIAAAAGAIGIEPDEVWCASGSGVLARGLAAAWAACTTACRAGGPHLGATRSRGGDDSCLPCTLWPQCSLQDTIPMRCRVRSQGLGNDDGSQGTRAGSFFEM